MMRRNFPLLCCLVFFLAGCGQFAPSPPEQPEGAELPAYSMPEPSLPGYFEPEPGPNEEILIWDLPGIPAEWGNMTSLYYEFGAYTGASYVYQISPQVNGTVHFECWGYNDAYDTAAVADLSPNILTDLQVIFDAFGVAAWDGFSGQNNDILDGYGFRLRAEFDSGHIFDAVGYMMYPPGYDEGHAAIAGYLYNLALQYPYQGGRPV